MNLLRVETLIFYAVVLCYFASGLLYFIFAFMKKERCGTWATWVMLGGFLLHTAALVVRGVNAGRLPLTNQYEFATSFAWGIALVFLIFAKKFKFKALGCFVAPVIFLIIGYAAMQSREINALMPALRSNWLGFHVSMAIVSYGAFGVAFGVALAYLLHDKLTRRAISKEHLPGRTTLDMICYRSIALGFLFLTLVIISGAIWAEQAWGTYWNWDPKETWSLITWIIYAIYLHLRLSRGWKGKKPCWFAVVGFVCVIFTYIGVNMFIPSIHSYA